MKQAEVACHRHRPYTVKSKPVLCSMDCLTGGIQVSCMTPDIAWEHPRRLWLTDIDSWARALSMWRSLSLHCCCCCSIESKPCMIKKAAPLSETRHGLETRILGSEDMACQFQSCTSDGSLSWRLKNDVPDQRHLTDLSGSNAAEEWVEVV